MEVQTENLKHADDRSHARQPCLVAKDHLKVVLQVKLLRSFNEDSSLEWLKTEADATPATNRAKAAIFMLAEWLGEQERNTENLNNVRIAAANWKLNAQTSPNP